MVGPLKVAIVGLQHLHPRSYMLHFQALNTLQVVAVSDPMQSLRAGFEHDFGVNAYADWRSLLANEAVDLAYIFLPHDECPAAAGACAAKGVHAVVEKPVANTARALARLSTPAAAHRSCSARRMFGATTLFAAR